MANKKRKCKHCGQYHPTDNGVVVGIMFFCSDEHRTLWAMDNAKTALEKVRAKKAKEERKERAEKKKSLKDVRDWTKDVQAIFNRYIRLRDYLEPCMSCGRTEDEVEWTSGGKWDCGHYQAVGRAPELRFEELNAHKQCKSCNGGSGKFAKKAGTVEKEYRIRLIKKIGLKNVEWLEGPHDPKKYTIDQLKDLLKLYKEKCKRAEQAISEML